MRGSLKYLLVVALCIAFATVLSYFAFFSYSFAPRRVQSVKFVRACNAIGVVVLLPAHVIFYSLGGLMDQGIPYSNPLNYIAINGVFLGFLIYLCIRPLVFKTRPTASKGSAGDKT